MVRSPLCDTLISFNTLLFISFLFVFFSPIQMTIDCIIMSLMITRKYCNVHIVFAKKKSQRNKLTIFLFSF